MPKNIWIQPKVETVRWCVGGQACMCACRLPISQAPHLPFTPRGSWHGKRWWDLFKLRDERGFFYFFKLLVRKIFVCASGRFFVYVFFCDCWDGFGFRECRCRKATPGGECASLQKGMGGWGWMAVLMGVLWVHVIWDRGCYLGGVDRDGDWAIKCACMIVVCVDVEIILFFSEIHTVDEASYVRVG